MLHQCTCQDLSSSVFMSVHQQISCSLTVFLLVLRYTCYLSSKLSPLAGITKALQPLLWHWSHPRPHSAHTYHFQYWKWFALDLVWDSLQCTFIPFPACGDSAFCKETENIHNTTYPTPHASMPHSTSTICIKTCRLIKPHQELVFSTCELRNTHSFQSLLLFFTQWKNLLLHK